MTESPAFPRDDLGSLLELDPNQSYAPLPHVCEVLCLPLAPQIKRVKAHSMLASGFKQLILPNLDGVDEKQPCLRVDLVPLWVASLDAASVAPAAQATVRSVGREMASVLWQAFKPQGFETDDVLLPNRWEQSTADVAYRGATAIANLAREQMLLERQISADSEARMRGQLTSDIEPNAVLLARTVRRVAQAVSERSRRNEYPGIFDGLYRQWGITSYRRMPEVRLREALEWLERWYGDAIGEPEPEPDI